MIKRFLNWAMGTIEEHDEEGYSKLIVSRSTDYPTPEKLLDRWAKLAQKADPQREVVNERRTYGERLRNEWRAKWNEQPGLLSSLPGTQLNLRF